MATGDFVPPVVGVAAAGGGVGVTAAGVGSETGDRVASMVGVAVTISMGKPINEQWTRVNRNGKQTNERYV